MKNSKWPAAVPDFLICDQNSEEDKSERAEGIIDLLISDHDIKNKRFLDFGCGEGHTIEFTLQTEISIGYDIKKSGVKIWEETQDNALLTTDFSKVKNHGVYDIILVNDVIDHCSNPHQALSEINSVSKSNTKIVFRVHPWCSRHGGHLYKKHNKAFAHLFLNEKTETKQKVYKPLEFYHNLFKKFPNWKIVQTDIAKQPVEPFFKNNNMIANKLIEIWRSAGALDGTGIPEYQMSQSFIDYVIMVK